MLLTVQMMNYLHSGRHHQGRPDEAATRPREARAQGPRRPKETSTRPTASPPSGGWNGTWSRTLASVATSCCVIGVHDDLTPIRTTMDEFKPTIAFNLMEAFADIGVFDQNVVSYLELLKVPYTGCNPRGLTLSRDKALAKKLLAYHRIPVPDFHGGAA